MAGLEKDPEWAAARVAAKADAEARAAALTRAEQPILRDLAVASIEVSSVWDLAA